MMARYIDAEKFRKFITEHLPYSCPLPASEAYGDILRMLEDEIATPTEDVAPVKHAHWIAEDPLMKCSHCGKPIDPEHEGYYEKTDGIRYEHILPKYCGYCGAKMDERSKE